MIWWLEFEKKPFQFWREIWIQVVVILLQLYSQYILGRWQKENRIDEFTQSKWDESTVKKEKKAKDFSLIIQNTVVIL